MPAHQATSHPRSGPGSGTGGSGFESLRQHVQAELLTGMPGQVARLSWNAEQIRSYQRTRLRALLAHAASRCPFHARRLRRLDTTTAEITDLTSLPVMTKTDMMAQFDDVVTDRRLTREIAEAALARSAQSPQSVLGSYFCLATGGSSGRRGIFVSDVGAMAEFASLIMRSALARTPARAGPGGLTIAFVAAGSPVHATGLAPRILAGSPVMMVPVPVTLQLARIVSRLNELQPPVLYGYPSILARLAREHQAGRLRIAPASITCTSETLLPEYREAMAAAFGVPVVNSFATTEGLIGCSAPDEEIITLASDGCIVELVNGQGQPVPPGTASARVLVTNLYNYVQPLIRYELSDSFTRQPDSDRHGHVRVTVAGRADEILHYAGADVHPLTV